MCGAAGAGQSWIGRVGTVALVVEAREGLPQFAFASGLVVVATADVSCMPGQSTCRGDRDCVQASCMCAYMQDGCICQHIWSICLG